ncbi:MAG: TonB-dependent receptor [Alcanivoracaceae bacterium]|nr:TonB-dependent receptor [Alcanivoracaceae bacterium]MCG8439248.1 TonB-dependent receptor [Pseudomonadales bacterium]MED5431747.1 TonB-dependent receptor [Pseudomonadota bacterium]MEE2870711.1 TonB-dependent receptor [Pseudomonadota bacterium]|tara:strand:+ start:3369 stop:5480 length:2112 start_codon:yes stop_codon:yes gene_type:complete
MLLSRRIGLSLSLLPLAAPTLVLAETDTNTLSPVTVTATRAQTTTDETPQKVLIISRDEIEQQQAISQDPGQVLSNLIPSYSPSRQKLSNAGESFRGRSPLFMIDGVPQSNPLRDSARDSYTIDLSMVERIEVIYGASAEHGLGATGGIINFVTRRADAGTLNQSVGISLNSDDDFDTDGQGHKIHYRVDGQHGDWDYLLAGSQQKRGVFYDGNDELVGIAYPGELQNSTSYDLMGRIGYWLDDNQNIELMLNHFELEGEGGYVPVAGDRDNGIPTTARKGQQDGNPGYNDVTTANLSYSHANWFNNKVDVQLYTQRFRAQFATTPFFPYPDGSGGTRYDQTRNQSDKVGAKFTLTRNGLLNNRLGLTTGLDLLQDETQQDLVHTGRTYVPETQYRNYAPFLQGRYTMTDKLNLNAGVRYEYAKLNVDTYSTIDRSNVTQDNVVVQGGSPDFNETLYNAGLVYQLTGWAQLYATYSEGFGMPDVGRVLRGISTPGQNVDTLLQIQPIVTDNREIGGRFNWERYGFELSYYESDSDLGERLTFNSATGTWEGSRERTEIQGVELSGHVQIHAAHRVKMSYTHEQGESDTTGNGVVDTELNGLSVAPDTLQLGWDAAWNSKLASHLQASHFFSRGFDDPDLDFDGYTLVDAMISYQLPAGQIDLGIENLTDEDYFTYYSQAARASDDYNFKGRGRTYTVGYNLDF